jgi:hypothetical protein
VKPLRRSALLLAITIAIALTSVLGLTAGTAQAAFNATTTMAPLGVSTLTVAAPTGLTISGSYCSTSTWSYSYNGTTTSGTKTTLHTRVSWQASATTRGVTGYRITASYPDGSTTLVGNVGPATTSGVMTVDGFNPNQNIRISVTTLTGYGWTADSLKSGALTC